jgi:hypothetical protein
VKSGKDVITFDAIASYCKQKLGYFWLLYLMGWKVLVVKMIRHGPKNGIWHTLLIGGANSGL